jgi:hypothetical protein
MVSGTLDLTTAAGISALPGGLNMQYTDITISGTLIVPSGTILRATGNVSITGTGSITVAPGAQDSGNRQPHPGVALSAATNILGGIGIGNSLQATRVLKPGPYGGGAGARFTTTTGGEGGGAFAIVARGNISLASGAQLNANGRPGANTSGGSVTGGGGGGGGVVTLLAKGTLTVSGTILANGGVGAPGVDANGGNGEGGGGGGGGGIVALLASSTPSVSGTIQVSGGTPGANAGSTAAINAGGGGGACGGNGGSGGSTTNPTPTAGGNGQVITITSTSPENLFL